ncbi:MAG: SAP domain-containing protein [Terracidiphilus sp.]|jgi:hypothetical protein
MIEPAFPADDNWRTSEGHQILLLYFTSPNGINSLPRSYNWADLLDESVESAVQRLVRDGGLRTITDAKWRIMHGRGAAELKAMCRSTGLKVSGSKEELAERIAAIDPTGSSFGTNEVLYVCSEDVAQFIEENRRSIDAIWGDFRGLQGLFSHEEFCNEKAALTHRFSAERSGQPSNDDVKWSLLNRRAIQHAAEGNLGLARNVYLAMADFLKRREKPRQALPLYLLVCAYDLNGAINRGGISGELLKRFPLFDSEFSTLAPSVIQEIQSITEDESMKLDEVSLDLPPKVRHAVETRFSANGELSHGNVA